MERLLMTEEIAEYLRVDVVTIRRLVNRSELAAYRIGGEYRFTESDLTDYLQRQRVPGSLPSSMVDAGPLITFMQKALQGKHTSPADAIKSGRFDRFSDQGRRVLTFSQEVAQDFQHNYIGTEHILLGLIQEEEGNGVQVLRNLGIELAKIRTKVEAIVGRGDRIVLGNIGLTPRAKKVIELAVDEARRLQQHYIGTEHILLGLLREGEGIGAGVLEQLGVKLEQARAETLQVSSQHPEGPFSPVPAEAASLLAEGEQGLTCSNCGAHAPNYFHYCFNCGQMLNS